MNPSVPTGPQPTQTSAYLICHSCDVAHLQLPLARRTVLRCVRCRAVLGRSHFLSPKSQLALTVAAGLCLLIGNFMSLVTLDLRGIQTSLSLPEAIGLMWQVGQPLVASMACAIAILFPLVLVLTRLYVLWPLSRGLRPRHFKLAMHVFQVCVEWSMVEVFLLSSLVAIVRSAGLAVVQPGLGLLAYAVVTLLLTALSATEQHGLWALGESCPP